MSKTVTVRAQIEAGLKDKAVQVFHKLGLSTTQAINLFYRQVELRQGLPFDVVIPNKTTRTTFEDTDVLYRIRFHLFHPKRMDFCIYCRGECHLD